MFSHLNGNKLDKIVKNYPDNAFSNMNVAIEELYEWVYAQYGSGIYSVNCRINSRHIAFIQADSNDYGCIILGGYFDTNLSYSRLNNGTWVHNKILLTSELSNIITKDFGDYNVSGMTLDKAVVDILTNKLPLLSDYTIIGRFSHNGSYRIIIQPYSTNKYSSAILFGYGASIPIYYRVANGSISRFNPSGNTISLGNVES